MCIRLVDHDGIRKTRMSPVWLHSILAMIASVACVDTLRKHRLAEADPKEQGLRAKVLGIAQLSEPCSSSFFYARD